MNRQREALLALQLLEQVEHLGLDRDVERRGRLVGDEQLGLERERAGDADALTLTTGELVRVAVAEAARQVHLVEQLLDLAC